MDQIVRIFNDRFSNWSIILPEEQVAQRKRGKILEAGWCIWFLFDKDDQGEFLDYYASHRMTSDEHVRIRVDGSIEYLPVISTGHMISDDPIENARLESEFYKENQRIMELLKAKGFVMEGDEPLAVQINTFLRCEKH